MERTEREITLRQLHEKHEMAKANAHFCIEKSKQPRTDISLFEKKEFLDKAEGCLKWALVWRSLILLFEEAK